MPLMEEDDYYYSDEDFDDYDVKEDEIPKNNKKKFTVLTEEDLQSRMDDDILKVSSSFSISRDAATILSIRYNWNFTVIQGEWLADQETVRKASGLFEEEHKSTAMSGFEDSTENVFVCLICRRNCPIAHAVMTSAACRHVFCKPCWRVYINEAINLERKCYLMLKCPQESCGATVGRSVINLSASGDDKKRYDKYLARSYVESKENIRRCPTPGCGCAVEYNGNISEILGNNFDVKCNCLYGFCWNCLEEAHSPVDCETVVKWTVKNNSNVETENWLLAKTKPCPQCLRPSEYVGNDDYLNMTCWLCCCALLPGPQHEERTGGLLGCIDIYKRQRAKDLWGYYERWYSNHFARERDFVDLHRMKSVNVEKLSEMLGLGKSQLWYITDAWIQIVECRRVLKWASVYGYYLVEHEHEKRGFFEYCLEQAEAAFGRLHQCADKELSEYLNANVSSHDFRVFGTRLANLTGVTKEYFGNLVAALENGLSDGCSHAATSSKTIKLI